MNLVELDAVELAERIRLREVSCTEVMAAYLDQIEQHNPRLNAIVALRDRDELMREAAERDREPHRGWLHGFPLAVKDLSAAAGLPWTFGSPVFAEQVAQHDDLFVRRMKDAGAIVIGKTNVPEFGLGSQTYNPVYGPTRNPLDPSRTPGGSSGGAAAAVAARMLPVADGSDYLGSLRNPAAFTNIYGFRPSLGRVPSTSFVAQLDTAGPMGRTVADVAALLSVQAGPDPRAPLSLGDDPSMFMPPFEPRDFAGTRIAWVGDFDGYLPMDPGVLDVCRDAFAGFTALGCEVVPAVPDYPMDRVWRAVLTWRGFNVAANLGSLYRAPELRAQLKPELVWELEQGLGLSAADLGPASLERTRWLEALLRFFEDYDFILAPSAQVFPFDVDVPWPKTVGGREMDTYHRWMETVAPWSLAGVPVLGMPAGFTADGLPMGVQLIGKPRADLDVLHLAAAHETQRKLLRAKA
ncbi:amidase [Amycolatopsis albispora]|uniref:Amidase n=1 Tax=Amycolatopsis albispora TaxID=1804986 RepID=A0A344LFR0_9PSEU|nr:amidase [Amycolatopsis albispora]AXB46884.1 amidase [Amycolatopsis albispora]